MCLLPIALCKHWTRDDISVMDLVVLMVPYAMCYALSREFGWHRCRDRKDLLVPEKDHVNNNNNNRLDATVKLPESAQWGEKRKPRGVLKGTGASTNKS